MKRLSNDTFPDSPIIYILLHLFSYSLHGHIHVCIIYYIYLWTEYHLRVNFKHCHPWSLVYCIFPKNTGIFPHNHSPSNKTRNFSIDIYYNLIHSPYWILINCINMSFIDIFPCPGSNLEPLIAFCCNVSLNMEWLLNFPLSFLILKFLKSAGDLCYRMSFNFSLCSVSLWLDSDYAFLWVVVSMKLYCVLRVAFQLAYDIGLSQY